MANKKHIVILLVMCVLGAGGYLWMKRAAEARMALDAQAQAEKDTEAENARVRALEAQKAAQTEAEKKAALDAAAVQAFFAQKAADEKEAEAQRLAEEAAAAARALEAEKAAIDAARKVASIAAADAEAARLEREKEAARQEAARQAEKKWHSILSFAYGRTKISSLGKSVYIPIQNVETDEFYDYAPNSPTAKSSSYTLFFGLERRLYSKWLMQAGVSYYKTAEFASSGILIQGVDTASQDAYGYHYYISPQHLLLEGKLLYSIGERYHPYVFLGLGPAFNKAHGFETTVSPTLAFTRAYADHLSVSLSYAIGMGVDVNLTSALRLGLGYRMMDLGAAKFGQSTIDGAAVPQTLSQTHIRASEFMLQITGILN